MGDIRFERGTRADYFELARYHYVNRAPATWAGVWTARWRGANGRDHLLGVAVLSWPTLRCLARERALGLGHMTDRRRARWVNANLRTISRVIVHPAARGLGVATGLVRAILEERGRDHIIEALAHSARGLLCHFDAAGMRRWEVTEGPIYFVTNKI